MNWSLQSVVGGMVMAIAVLGFFDICRESVLLTRLRRRGITTTGTVIRHLPRSNGVDSPVIQFISRQGERIEYRPSRTISKKFYPQGHQFSVVYLAAKPHKARLTGSEMRPRMLVIGVVICAVLLGVGLLITGALPQSPEKSVVVTVGPDSPMKWLAALGMALFEIFLVGGYIYQVRSLRALRREGLFAGGTVVRVFKEHQGQRGAVIEFFDSNYRRFQFVTRSPARSAGVGTQVSVIYRPDSPEDAQLASLSRAFRSLLIIIPITLILLISGFVLFS